MAFDPITLIILALILVVVIVVIAVTKTNKKNALATNSFSSGRSNSIALVAFILSFFMAVPAVICGHVALGQINKTGDSGRGFAVAGLIIGYFTIAVGIAAIAYVLSVGGAQGMFG